jgi:purine-binding chemotaxis protein CheW
MQYLTFRLGGVEYAVDVTAIETVVELGPIVPVPSPIEYMRGVMDLRGLPIPIIDLRLKLGLPRGEDDRRSNIIVIALGDDRSSRLSVGTLVDEVSEVITLDESGIEAARGEAGSVWKDYVRGVLRFEGRMIVVISVDGLFSIGEIEGFRAA